MAQDVNKFLTIVIPTFNREKQLLRLLRSIERQEVVDKYYIVILNNHSDYNVDDSLKRSFSGDFLDNIEVYNRPYNAGGDYNIGSAFLYAKTQYLWIIGDDDEVIDGCIDIIENDILCYPEIPFIKYHNKNHSSYNTNLIVSNITDFKFYYKKKYFTAGDIIFVSTNVYNINKLQSYIPQSLYYSYCSVPHILPMLGCLIDEESFMLSHRELVKYNAPEGDHWNLIKISTSLSTFLDIFYGKNYKIVQDVFYIITNHFGLLDFLQDCIKIEDRSYRKYVYKKAGRTIYRYKTINDYFLISLYKIEDIVGVRALYLFSKFTCSFKNRKIITVKRLEDKNNVICRLYKQFKNIKSLKNG